MYLVCFYSLFSSREVTISKHRTLNAALKARDAFNQGMTNEHYITKGGIKIA